MTVEKYKDMCSKVSGDMWMAAWGPEVDIFLEENNRCWSSVSQCPHHCDKLPDRNNLKRRGGWRWHSQCHGSWSPRSFNHGLLAQCFQACGQAKHHDEKAWQRKTTHFMAARKERGSEGEGDRKEEQKGPEYKMYPSHPLISHFFQLLSFHHLWVMPSNYSSIDKDRVDPITSPEPHWLANKP